ncbi:general odorant-binding protein 28a-like [Cylas formicarius]|nr:general odorant-binding protein 28a-like [Cylas formicarius]
MKYYFGFLMCLAMGANALDQEIVEEILEEIQRVGVECIKETSAAQSDIAELMAKKMPSTHEGKCMLFCFSKHYNMMNDDGSLVANGIESWEKIKNNDAELYEKIVQIHKTCHDSAVIDEDPCETATGLAKCGMEEARKAGLHEQFAEF